MKVLFWLVKNKVNKQGVCPVYCRITIDGKRVEINSGVVAKENEFDNVKKKLKGSSDLVKAQNEQLERLSFKIHDIYYSLVFSEEKVTALQVKKQLFVKNTQVSNILDLINEYAKVNYKKLKSRNIKQKPSVYTRYIELIEEGLINIKRVFLAISKFDDYILDELAYFLVKTKGYKVSYIKKIFAFLKGAFAYAHKQKYLDKIYFDSYKFPFYAEKSEFIYLEENELAKIEKYIFNQTLQKSADAFLMQCYTGLAYIDLKKLGSHHLTQDIKGVVWINISRQKVSTSECVIPVITKAWHLLKKYNYDIPLISIQKYNKALKEICMEVGINKNVTSHVGRKTYGTLLLNKDVPIETVSSLLGHSNIRITQRHYAKVLHMKIARDIKLVM